MSAAIAAMVIAGVGTGYAIYSGEKAKEKQKEQDEKLALDVKNQEGKEEAAATRDSMAQRRRRTAAQNQVGRGGTMLTSPLDSFGANLIGSGGGKSLIGQ